MPIIEIEDLRVKYRMAKDYALSGVNLKIDQGEFVGIIGPTGAGKSSLCMCLPGLVPNMMKCDEFHGRVVVDGFDTRDHTVGKLSQHVGIVFQDYESQLFRTSVLLEAAFGPENLGLSLAEIRKRVGDALKWTRMEGLESRYTFALSGGQKQRLAIAAVLSMLPKVLVLDEATSDLDPVGKYELYEVVKELKAKEKITLIMVDHHLDRVAEIATRVIVMNGGKVVYDDEPRRVFSHVDELIKMGLAPPQVTEAFHKLGYQGNYPINVDEAVSELPRSWSIVPPKDTPLQTSGKPAVEVVNLWHSYEPGAWVLKNLNLRIDEGEFLGLIGQNGSGKTTLAHVITGITIPRKGRLKIMGEDVTGKTVLQLGKTVGYVFQNPDYQLFASKVSEELAFGPRQLKLPPEKVEERVQSCLKVLGIEHLAEEDPFFLNKANRERVAVGSILTLEPKIMILDEPTTGLSPGETRKIMELARELNRQGITVITITHDMWVVTEYCRRTVVIHGGEIILDGPTRDVFSKADVLSKCYLAPPQITQFSLKRFGETFLGVDEFIQNAKKS